MSPLHTREEELVMELLAGVWNKFCSLPELHPCDKVEFMRSIHSAQRIIMARPVLREQEELTKNEKGGKK